MVFKIRSLSIDILFKNSKIKILSKYNIILMNKK